MQTRGSLAGHLRFSPWDRRRLAAAVDVRLSQDDLARIEAVFPRGAAAGERYPAAAMSSVNR